MPNRKTGVWILKVGFVSSRIQYNETLKNFEKLKIVIESWNSKKNLIKLINRIISFDVSFVIYLHRYTYVIYRMLI